MTFDECFNKLKSTCIRHLVELDYSEKRAERWKIVMYYDNAKNTSLPARWDIKCHGYGNTIEEAIQNFVHYFIYTILKNR